MTQVRLTLTLFLNHWPEKFLTTRRWRNGLTLSWTAEQIINLAPDSGSAKAGKELANRRKWQTLGFNEVAAWGECQGSAKTPYLAAIDLAEPAFRCTCPSRKFPCKHSLGLFLMLADQPEAFARTERPAEPPG